MFTWMSMWCQLCDVSEWYALKPEDILFLYRHGESLGVVFVKFRSFANTFWPKKTGQHFADNKSKCIFLREKYFDKNSTDISS